MTLFQTLGNGLRRFSLFAAGADSEVLSYCSSADRRKYSMLGSLIYIPVATSTVGILFAATYFTRNPLTVAGVILGWGIVVFLIERAIIAHLRPGELSLAVVLRVVLALALSTIVAELLTVFVFRPDIDDRIRREQAAELSLVSASGQERITALKAELDERKAAVDAKEKAYLDEIDGRNGTGIHGYGPSARAKEAAYLGERGEYEAARVRLEAELDEARAARDEAVASTAGAQQRGLLQSFTVLYEMAEESVTVLVVLIILHVYFLLVELLPLTVKLHFKDSQYYEIQDALNEQRLSLARETIRLQTDFELKRRQLEMENAYVRLEIDSAGERAVLQSKSLVDTYMAMAKVESEASTALPGVYLAPFKRGHDAVLDKYIDSSNAAISAA